MTEPSTVAVVGAGLAGGKAVEALRAEGFGGRIVLFGDERHRPYERPPLSKGYLQGNDERDTVFVHPESWYGEHDVDLRLGVGVDAIEARNGVSEVRLADGASLPADLVVVGIGVQPEVGLAREAGLAVGDGVLVDGRLRTSDPDVFAVGDIAGHDHPVLGRRVRVEHWDNAIHQARAAARVMLGGDQPYDRLPYFFTDQYDLGMEYVGNPGPDGYDRVVLTGDVPGRVFRAWWLRGDRVVAGMHANDWDAIDEIRRVVGTTQALPES